jgi:hypothetical protein
MKDFTITLKFEVYTIQPEGPRLVGKYGCQSEVDAVVEILHEHNMIVKIIPKHKIEIYET